MLYSLLTGTDGWPEFEVTELKTMPQIRSTQFVGVPCWALGLLVLVAQGMVIQSVTHWSPTTEPNMLLVAPVTLNDMAGMLAKTVLGKNVSREWRVCQYLQMLTTVSACSVLDAAEVPLHPDAG